MPTYIYIYTIAARACDTFFNLYGFFTCLRRVTICTKRELKLAINRFIFYCYGTVVALCPSTITIVDDTDCQRSFADIEHANKTTKKNPPRVVPRTFQTSVRRADGVFFLFGARRK